jgi:hypothetical protein
MASCCSGCPGRRRSNGDDIICAVWRQATSDRRYPSDNSWCPGRSGPSTEEGAPENGTDGKKEPRHHEAPRSSLRRPGHPGEVLLQSLKLIGAYPSWRGQATSHRVRSPHTASAPPPRACPHRRRTSRPWRPPHSGAANPGGACSTFQPLWTMTGTSDVRIGSLVGGTVTTCHSIVRS